MKNERKAKSRLSLTNTLSKEKETFHPREDKKVKMFTCGPSIYQRPHIGNYRAFLYEDILQRYLEYLGYQVERLINFTDIEDKAINKAQKEGIRFEELTEPIAEQFLKEADLLRIKLPDYIPRSSTSVDQAVYLIKILLDKGYAYCHEKDIFYDPLKFEGFGKLFGLDMSRWPKRKRRFRKDTYPGQRWNLGDFILWRGCKERQESDCIWDTPLGRGRPAWNIQDPAMITKHLGYQIDIACGGVDNLYRHHDYTIAVVEAVSGKEFAYYWLHGEHLLIDGAKMSKSKGNIIYPEDILAKGYSPEHLRFFLIYEHYRRKINLTMENFQKTAEKIDSFKDMVKKITVADFLPDPDSKSLSEKSDPDSKPDFDSHYPLPQHSIKDLLSNLLRDFENSMNDDLQVKRAFDALYENLLQLVKLKMEQQLSYNDCQKVQESLEKIDAVLQVIFS